MNSYYVYFLLDPTNYYLPFYIGKGKDNRWHDHLVESKEKTDNIRKYYKIQKLLRNGYNIPFIKWQENMSESNAYDLETELIEKFGRQQLDKDGILTNICIDNKPPSQKGRKQSIEHRKKIGDSNRNKKKPERTEKHKTNLSKANKGKVSPKRGIPLSEEHKSQLSIIAKSKPKAECPYCHKTGLGPIMKRWHFDRCKTKR